MQVEFVRFQAADHVELQGWLRDCSSEAVVIHIHGMSGNGYENYFLDTLGDMYTAQKIAFFAIDTRGRGIISSFRKNGGVNSPSDGTKLGGSCYEILEESVQDIAGAIAFLRSRGKKRFILQGHSLGGTKVVNYMCTQNTSDIDKVVLLAPTDMVGWASTDPRHDEYVAKARQLVAEGRGEELVGSQCWLDLTPISAQTYLTICVAGTSADIYGARDNGSLLGSIKTPLLIAYGDDDIGIKKIDGTMAAWQARIEKIKHDNTQVAVIPGAAHGFKGREQKLRAAIDDFVVDSSIAGAV